MQEMNSQSVDVMKGFLMDELDLVVRTTSNLIQKVSVEHWDYRPSENMRSLLEVTQHLVAIPSVDLLILQEGTEEEVKQLEQEIEVSSDADVLIDWMKKGVVELKKYMYGLPDDDFLTKKTKPFYLDHGSEQGRWLVEIVTHTHHHRSQLFNYLKQLGYEVNMFDLY